MIIVKLDISSDIHGLWRLLWYKTDIPYFACMHDKTLDYALCIIAAYTRTYNLECEANFVADNILNFFKGKISLDVACESSAWQTSHMQCQDLFSLKKKKKSKCLLLQLWLEP